MEPNTDTGAMAEPPINWEMVGHELGPYLHGALSLLTSLGIMAPVGPLQQRLWSVHDELSTIVAACGRFAPRLTRAQEQAMREILVGVRAP